MDTRWLVALYPARWRERYGDELEALLEAEPASPSVVIDLMRGAIHAHLSPQPAGAIPMRSRTLTATSILAVLLVVPAVTFLTAAIVRGLQPTEYQPAHAAQVIFDAFAAMPAAAIWLLLGLAPLVALALAVLVAWRKLDVDAAARADLAAFAEGWRRVLHQPALVLAGLAFLASAAVLVFAVTHAIAG